MMNTVLQVVKRKLVPHARFTWLVGATLLVAGPVYGFLSDNQVHAPPTSGTFAYNTFKPGAAGFPAVGGTYVDPVFGSTVKRLTNVPNAANGDDIYAKHWANADGTLAFHRNTSGTHVIRISNGSMAYASQPQGLSGTEMHWDALDPDAYYYFSGANLVRRKLSTQTSTVVKTFPSTLQNNGGSLNIQTRNGRYFTVRYGGTNKVWDSQLDIIYTGSVTPTDQNGWVGITPDGNYLVNAGNGMYSQAVDHTTRTISSTRVMFWNLCGDHGDLISTSNGKSYFVTGNCNNIAALYRVDITLNQAGRSPAQQSAAQQLLIPVTWEDAGHYSCVSKGVYQDWCFYSSESIIDNFNSSTSGWTAYKQEIIAINVMTLAIRRLAHHRSRSILANYTYMPRVSSSWDGSVVLWTSNFNISSPNGYADMYAIESPLGAIPPGPLPAPQNLQVQ